MQRDLVLSFYVLCGQNKTRTIHIFEMYIIQVRLIINNVIWYYIMHATHMPAIGNLKILNLEI